MCKCGHMAVFHNLWVGRCDKCKCEKWETAALYPYGQKP